MANEVTIFDNIKSVPAFMQAFDSSELAAYMSDSYATLSIKGKAFAIVKNGERSVLYAPGTRDILQRINVIVLRAGKHPAKRFYKGTFKDGEENDKPACFSFNGLTPDAASVEPQCKSCGACRNNAFGTARMANGTTGKGKACADYVRLAVCPADPSMHDEVYYLAVPAASIKGFNNYVTTLVRHKVPLHGVRTEISFDPMAATPKLIFTAISLVDSQEEFQQLSELRDNALVTNIVNGAASAPATPAVQEAPVQLVRKPVGVTPLKSIEEKAADAILDKAFATFAKPAAEEVTQPAPQPVAQPQPVEPAAKPAAPSAKVVATEQALGEALSSLGF